MVSKQYEIELVESPLVLTKIEQSSEYEFKGETSTSFTLSFDTSLSPILSPVLALSTPINSLSLYYNISQHNL